MPPVFFNAGDKFRSEDPEIFKACRQHGKTVAEPGKLFPTGFAGNSLKPGKALCG